MHDVIFIRDEGLEPILKKEFSRIFKKGENVAVKLHMGEKGNKFFLKPELVKKFITVLKDLGAAPFLFDSPAIYPGGRNTVEKYQMTAKEHGFANVGCPIIISDESIKIKTEHLDAEVCKPLFDADALLVLSHVKGHMCSGFGGAIKNLGMGGLSVKTKKDIHAFANPVMAGDCMGCGSCIKVCPVNAISLKNNQASINYSGCWGCGACVVNCPEKALKNKIASFDELIAEGASAVLKNKKAFFVNVLRDITKLCDCCSDPQGIVLSDIGILLSDNIVSIEKASFDLINKNAGKDLFKELHHKSPLAQIVQAEKKGLGSQEYRLVEK